MYPKNQTTSEAFEALKEYMVTNFNAKIASGGKEIVKRCHFCGDSRDPTARHLYIGISDGLIKYNCFKCNARGLVDAKFLRDLDCFDTGLINLCMEQNKKIYDPNYSKTGNLESIYRLNNIYIPYSNNDFAIKKLDYLSRRMGYIFNNRNAIDFKIVLNLKDFLYANHIDKYTRHPDLIDLLDKYFIGFLSMDNKYVIMRRLIPEGKLPNQIDSRYLNYNITGRNDGMKYYIIPNIIDISKPLDIHIAEGPFDILSIYLNIAPIGGNAIYSAICGKSYLNLVKFFITSYGFTGFNLHIYPDSDIDMKDMRIIKNQVSIFGIQCYIHRNLSNGQKDYGVSIDKIVDSVTKL